MARPVEGLETSDGILPVRRFSGRKPDGSWRDSFGAFQKATAVIFSVYSSADDADPFDVSVFIFMLMLRFLLFC